MEVDEAIPRECMRKLDALWVECLTWGLGKKEVSRWPRSEVGRVMEPTGREGPVGQGWGMQTGTAACALIGISSPKNQGMAGGRFSKP